MKNIIRLLGLVCLTAFTGNLYAQSSATYTTTSLVPHSPQSLPAIESYSDAQLAQLINALAATPLIWPTNGGVAGTYWSLAHPSWPPLPTAFGTPFWNLSPASSAMTLSASSSGSSFLLLDDVDYPPIPGTNSGGGYIPGYFGGTPIDTNGLWIELSELDTTNQLAYVTAHNTVSGDGYQLFTKTNLLQTNWVAQEVIAGTYATNVSFFDAGVSISNIPAMFFRVEHTNNIVSLSVVNSPAYRSNASAPGQDGVIQLQAFYVNGETANDITVYYQMSGTASNGIDYSTLSGVVTIPASSGIANIDIHPLAETRPTNSVQTATLTLIATNSYLIYGQSGTMDIYDSSTTVSLYSGIDAIRPYLYETVPAQVGFFELKRVDSRTGNTNSLTVYYQVGGTARNGIDYATLPGSITFAPNQSYTNIYIEPFADYGTNGNQTVTITLLQTNTYYLDTNNATETINLLENTNLFAPVTGLTAPIGIDYDVPLNSLIVSYNYNGGSPTFARLYTAVTNGVTNLVVTPWSGIGGLSDEVKLATVKANAAGFVEGDMYFGSDTNIGWLSEDGTVSNLNWCTLTNLTVTNSLPLRGSLYVDQTGIFSNDLIAVTSPASGDPTTSKGVWMVNSQAQPTLLTNLLTQHLEGVITLPNDTNRFGPWAGKIITGDEDQGVLYTIDTNGTTVAYDTTKIIAGGIGSEDFDIIPANQNLYACAPNQNVIVKLGASYFTNYVGDLLITQAGDGTYANGGAVLFIVHWNAATTNFTTLAIPLNSFGNHFEHVTFAPIDLLTP